MAESSFRATFTADNSSFSATMREMKDESHIMAQSMIADANKIAQATDQSVNKVLAEQISLYERGRRATMRQERAQLDANWAQKMMDASPENKSGIQAQWDVAKKDFQEQHKLDHIQIDILRDIVDAINNSALRGTGSEESQERVAAFRAGKKLSDEEEYVARIQDKVDQKKEKDPTMWDVAKGTIIGQAVMGMLSRAGNAMSGAINDPDGDIGAARLWGALPAAGGTIESIVSRHMQLAETADRLAVSLNSRGANIGHIQDESGFVDPNIKFDTANLDKVSSINDPRDMNPSSSRYGMRKSDRMYNPNWKQDDDNEKARMKSEWENNPSNPMSWSYEGAGVDHIKFLEAAGKLAPELGTSSGLRNQTKSFFDITQGGGISEGTTLSMANLLRLGGGGDLKSTMGQVSGALGDNGVGRAIRDKHISEVVGIGESRYSSGFANVDPVMLSKVKAGFKSNFGEALSSADNIQSIMSAMSKPSDEFQQGLNYKIYAEQMAKDGKEASYVGFKKWQEKPENGLLSGKMDYIKSVYGDGEFGVMAANAAGIGKTWEANELYLKGGTKGLSPDELRKKGEVSRMEATDYKTSRMEKQAVLNDEYIKSSVDGLMESINQIGSAILKNTGVLSTLQEFLKKNN